MTNEYGKRIVELLNYLNLTYNEFAKECGFTNYLVLKKIVTGETKAPNISTLDKIITRYPVNGEWLYLGKGKMWEFDYFEKRFNAAKKNFNSPAEKINGLLDIFETKMSPFALRTDVPKYIYSQIRKGDIKSISSDVKHKITNAYSFIPIEYFN